ncbi:MAG: hypothetical protein WCC87_10420 [Candidatus Korobacteraceae bacterium]
MRPRADSQRRAWNRCATIVLVVALSGSLASAQTTSPISTQGPATAGNVPAQKQEANSPAITHVKPPVLKWECIGVTADVLVESIGYPVLIQHVCSAVNRCSFSQMKCSVVTKAGG